MNSLGTLIFLFVFLILPAAIAVAIKVKPLPTFLSVLAGYCLALLGYWWIVSDGKFIDYLLAVGLYSVVPVSVLVLLGTTIGICLRKVIAR